MRIGVISDTHIQHQEDLPEQTPEVFREVDLILHAGDVCELRVLDELERIAPVIAARGDDDHFGIPDPRVKDEHLLTLEGLTLWLRHRMPFGVVWALNQDEQPELGEEVRFQCGQTPDIVVFGDTHKAVVKRTQGILFVNPGSATLPDYVCRPGTVAILTLVSGEAEVSLVQLE